MRAGLIFSAVDVRERIDQIVEAVATWPILCVSAAVCVILERIGATCTLTVTSRVGFGGGIRNGLYVIDVGFEGFAR